MSDEESTPATLRRDVNYRPLPIKEIDTSNDQSSPPPSPCHASIWRITFKYVPFYVHFALTLLLATIFLGAVDGRLFNINSRRPQYIEADGTLSNVTSYFPLQSDVVTAVSVACTATRVAGGWWAAGYIWRCIFMAMEGGGISLEGLSQVISNRPPLPRHFTRRTHMVTIYITLLTTFAIDYFSAVLTGSVTWEPADRLILGGTPVSGIFDSSQYYDLLSNFYLTDSKLRNKIAQQAYTTANFAWVNFQQSLSSKILGPSSTFRRVIPGAHTLPINSTAANITMPVFIVDDFRWIEDLDPLQLSLQFGGLLNDSSSEFSPFIGNIVGRFGGGLLPDRTWGPSRTTPMNFHIVSESRLFAWQPESYVVYSNRSCQQDPLINPGTQINLYPVVEPIADHLSDLRGAGASNRTVCFAIANVTYRAGVATCQHCSFISATVLEGKAPLSLSLAPDPLTSLALAITPAIGAMILTSGYALPANNYERTKDLAIDLTSRAYQSAWAALTDSNPAESALSTTVEIALPTLRAKIIPWRVYLWATLHLGVLVLGLLFMFIQSHYQHPWVEDTTMAVFWLDTRAAIESDDQDVDPWQRGTEICRNGMLVLDEAGEGSRSVKIKRA